MNTGSISTALHLAMATATTVAFGGVKYWDNGHYDADSYVTNGLTLHYDGIRNVGLEQPHSTNTLDWVNLGPNSPAKNMEWSSRGTASLSASRRNSTHGNWTGNGFHFDGGACWIKWNDNGQNPVVIPSQYTMQFAMTAATADQTGDGDTGYIFFPHTSFGWKNGTVAIRSSANGTTTAANAVYAVDETRLGGTSVRPHFSNATPRYATVLSDGSALRTFEGTTLPASGDSGYAAITGSSPARSMNVVALGGIYDKIGSDKTDGAFQGFTGTLHSYRLYSRALTEEELAWNRVVDEKRFFGTQLPIPATNAVIRSNIRRASGPEPVGCYAVDSNGYTFTAPASTNIDGHVFALLSATKETWDSTAGAWGAAESVAVGAADASVSVASSDLVRISWKWRETSGIYTADDYTIDDIVTDGLVLHYDGILNDGIGKPHGYESLNWQNLAEGFKDWPLVRVDYRDDDEDGKYDAVRSFYYSTHAGEWCSNGFVFDGSECMMKWNDSGDHKFVLYPEYTFQFAMTASTADQAESNGGISYLFFPRNELAQGDWQGGSISIRSTADANIGIPADSILLTDAARYGSTNVRPSFSNPSPHFANIVADSSAARVFEGVEWPTSGNGYKAGSLSASRTSNWFAIGGQYSPQTGREIKHFQGFHGTLHSIRYYDRALAEWELKRNRNVDSSRFFGGLGVTNVLVEVEEDSGIVATPAAGAYSVEGQYTFTTANGAFLGRLWDLDPSTGTWTNPREISTRSYTYDESSATAVTQKLRWSKVKAFVIEVR